MTPSRPESFKNFFLIIGISLFTAFCLHLPYDFELSAFSEDWLRPEGSMPEAWYPWMTIHIASGSIAILLGLFQVFKVWRKNSVSRHKKIGILYVLTILLAGAPSGYYLAVYSIGGFHASVGYALQTSVWWILTLKGALYARNTDKALHKKWIGRSFAVSLSPITHRLVPYILFYFDLSSEKNAFIIIAWVSWSINLLIYEVFRIIKRK